MTIFTVYQWIGIIFQFAIPMLIAIAAIIGVILVLSTRADAFDAADRKSKGIWAGMLAGSAVFLGFPMLGWAMLGIPIIASLVITGIYWMDVRPQIKSILDNAQGGW